TMNIADRSLALVDLALRRRFAFVDLEPKFNEAWRRWLEEQCGVEEAVVRELEQRIIQLNQQIESDPRLGKQFRIGHSYVTPSEPLKPGSARSWFQETVDTEIGPLLEEYWFDAPTDAAGARERLLKDW